ncbi:hypothetical protein BDV98DRAFT_113505 [Pterulicium gracile]|uniref:HMG box domain-containing protein n=1 Tax=Pterulicium gracile TaxID=1884261 RepID=A0A5C3QGJ3_9AGAR|nr:hypothetical protein BDV98DRAFT_113505 [Pterula gracilis]
MTFYQNAPRILNPPQSTTLPHLAPSPNSGSPASEEGYGTAYMPADKGDGDYNTVEDTSLTAQTLNADGTPKRPMNAFMIFARKRRPQLSAENQSMRTGEISKILSKEWNSMPPVSLSPIFFSSSFSCYM